MNVLTYLKFVGTLAAVWVALTLVIWVILTKLFKFCSSDATMVASLTSVALIMFGSLVF